MNYSQILSHLSLTDIILIGSAAMFFSTVGMLSGLVQKRIILWAAIVSLLLIGFFYRNELYYQWLVLTH